MKTAGLIAEFNPFHNGHKYILEQIKKDFDAVVAIMSGSFVQRGDTAITDKHTRALAALKNGADLVIELPVIYALNTAQRFAHGAVSLLEATGAADALVFGSESGSVKELADAARLLENEPPEVSERLRQLVSSGMSFPAAREKAFEGHIASGLLSEPNNILAIEYIRALYRTGSGIEPITVRRTNSYHDTRISGAVISASAVRRLLTDGGDISPYVPDADFDLYSIKALDNAVTYHLRTVSGGYLSEINDVSEGLENRIIKAAAENVGFEAICAAAKPKRFTMSRIRRVVLSSFLGLTKELCAKEPSYIRVLGMNETGITMLKKMKKTASLPVITKTAAYAADDIFKADIRASEAAALCRLSGALRAGREYTSSPVVLKKGGDK